MNGVLAGTSDIRWRVAPSRLVKVSPKFHRGMFGEFADIVRARITQFRDSKSWDRREKARFFEWLLTEIDAEQYGRLQETYLRAPVVDFGYLKYLDPIIWFEHKLTLAHKLGLHEGPRRRILDIGTGPGHFLLVARFYGHDAIGTEIPDDGSGVGTETDAEIERQRQSLFNSFEDVFCLERIRHRVQPFQPLSMLPRGFDLVTAFSVYFDRGPDWTKEAWAFFLDELHRHVLTETGSVFMTLIKARLRKEHWDYLGPRSRAGKEGVVWLTRTGSV